MERSARNKDFINKAGSESITASEPVGRVAARGNPSAPGVPSQGSPTPREPPPSSRPSPLPRAAASQSSAWESPGPHTTSDNVASSICTQLHPTGFLNRFANLPAEGETLRGSAAPEICWLEGPSLVLQGKHLVGADQTASPACPDPPPA